MSWFGPLSAHGLVDRHFAGQNGRWAERRLWRHLRGCARCRTSYRAHEMLEALAPGGEAAARERLARGVFAPRPRPLVFAGALAAAAALVLIVPRLRPAVRPGDDFVARGGAADAGGPAVTLYRVPASGAPQRAGAVIHADDALAFAYTNPGPAARYLMIFARDPAGRVYWYHPAWRDPAARPTAVPITPADRPVELGESVRHPLAPGPLTLTALFCDVAHDVVTVEAAARRGQPNDDGLRALGRVVHERLEVLP